MENLNQLKPKYDEYLDSKMEELWEISKFIHSHPELCFEEHQACEIQCNYLAKNGFQVQTPVGSLDTAFVATFGSGKPHIAVVSEYDALPIGHACGHNLISTAALGTAIETQKFMEENNITGTLSVIGTPAEESGGGKIILLNNGVFNDVDAVLMMHPTSAPTRLAGACLSSNRIHLEFFGKSAHAGSHPDDGVNALSAANLYLVATGLLRQHFKSDLRLSGIITDGGKSTGLIPDYAEIKGSISCFNLKYLQECTKRIENAALGCAQAMGCECKLDITPGYQGRVPNSILSEVCRQELIALEEPLLDGMPIDYGGEDLGNVSRIIPICNPYVTIFKDYKISNHTEQFKELAISSAGYRCIQIASKSMARTAMELFNTPSIIEEAKAELQKRLLDE